METFFATYPWVLVIITFLGILFFTWLASYIVAKLMRKLLNNEKNPFVANTIFINIMRVAIWITGISIILDKCFNVNATALIAALGVGGIAISLGLKDTIANLIGGVQLSILKLTKPGDRVEYGGMKGRVQDVTWRHTTVRDALGDIIVVPNSTLNSSTLVLRPDIIRVEVPFFVAAAHVTPACTLDTIADKIRETAEHVVSDIEPLEGETEVFFCSEEATGYRGIIVLHTGGISRDEVLVDVVLRAIDSFGFLKASS